MIASLVLVLLPTDLLRPASSLVQLVAIPQWAVRESAVQVTAGIRQFASEKVSAEEHQRVVQEKAAVDNEVASLRQQLAEAQRNIEELSRLRGRLKTRGTLVPARVLSADAAAGRDSLLIGNPRTLRARQGDWVASRMFLDVGSDDGVQEQVAVLARECLVGWVEQSSLFASRVVLLTDPQANRAMQVRMIPRGRQQAPLMVQGRPATFPLSGAGGGRMIIPDIPSSVIEAGHIQVGDLATSDPGNPRLPIAMVVGEIRELVHNRKKPLFYDAVVTPLCDPATLSQVYVLDVSR